MISREITIQSPITARYRAAANSDITKLPMLRRALFVYQTVSCEDGILHSPGSEIGEGEFQHRGAGHGNRHKIHKNRQSGRQALGHRLSRIMPSFV
eukprot:7699477-Pyramimonas_sp.AAC.1